MVAPEEGEAVRALVVRDRAARPDADRGDRHRLSPRRPLAGRRSAAASTRRGARAQRTAWAMWAR